MPGDQSVYLKMGGRLFMAIKWKLYETVFVKPGMEWGAVPYPQLSRLSIDSQPAQTFQELKWQPIIYIYIYVCKLGIMQYNDDNLSRLY